MRWPLKHQILLPMVLLLLAALIGVSVVDGYLSVQRTRQRIETDLEHVTDTLASSNFPLTDNILRQMKGLAGAEFVLTDDAGAIQGSSLPLAVRSLPIRATSDSTPLLAAPITLGNDRYFPSQTKLERLGPVPTATVLHVLYPVDKYQQAWRDIVYPRLIVGGMATVLAFAASFAVASRVTQPLSELQKRVDRIATGEFESISVGRRNDEISDLVRSINQMSTRLGQYEITVRRAERLRTLDQLAGGMAHQLRNSLTGTRMALELHLRECTVENEGLHVAMRQLELMERYVQRFLQLGRSGETPQANIELQSIVENVMTLVKPTAQHVGVQLSAEMPDRPLTILGVSESIEQLLVNLVLNGVEAAAPSGRGASAADTTNTAFVRIRLSTEGQHVCLAVEDSGPGPLDNNADLFEPFLTTKPDGTGLGLAVAREVAETHRGRIAWERAGEMTRFVVEFPAVID